MPPRENLSFRLSKVVSRTKHSMLRMTIRLEVSICNHRYSMGENIIMALLKRVVLVGKFPINTERCVRYKMHSNTTSTYLPMNW